MSSRYHFKIALRSLVKQRSFSLINLLGLSTGLAATLIVALFVHYELSFDKHIQGHEQVVRTIQHNVNEPEKSTAGLHFPAATFLAQERPEIASIARIHPLLPRLGSHGEKSFMEQGFILADASIFEVFALEALAGNLEEALTRPTDIVITEPTAVRYFGADWMNNSVIGKTIRVKNNTDYQVAAVIPAMPANSHLDFDLILPYGKVYANFITNNWNFSRFYTYARLNAAQDLKSFDAALADFTARHYPEERKEAIKLAVQPITSIHLDSQLSGELSANGSKGQVNLFMLIAVLITAIACMNFTNLMTALATRRNREVGVKKVLGIRRSQLVRQFLAEALILTGFALVLAIGITDLLIATFNDIMGVALEMNTLLAWPWVLGMLALGILLALLSGAYPSLYLTQLKPVAALRTESRMGARGRFGKVLVTFQFLITTALIVGMITIYKQLDYLRNKDLGFDREAIIMLRSHPQVNARYDAFRNSLMSRTQVENVGFGYGNLPGGGSFAVRAQFDQNGGDEITPMSLLYADYALPQTMGLEMADGRWFSKSFLTDSTQAFVLNEAAVKFLGWEGEALGKQIRYFGGGMTSLEKTGRVVGVVKDFFHESLYEELSPMVITLSHTYVPTFPNAYIPIRVKGKDLQAAMTVVNEVWEDYAAGIPADVRFMDEKLNALYEKDQKFGEILNVAGLLGLVIAAVGVFGLASFIVQNKTREIGIRKVLGASVKELLLMMLKGFLKPVAIAFVIAAPLALYLISGWLDHYAYRISPGIDIFVWTASISFLVALVAVFGQSYKAAGTNPVHILRND